MLHSVHKPHKFQGWAIDFIVKPNLLWKTQFSWLYMYIFFPFFLSNSGKIYWQGRGAVAQSRDAPEEAVSLPDPWPGGSVPSCFRRSPASGASDRQPCPSGPGGPGHLVIFVVSHGEGFIVATDWMCVPSWPTLSLEKFMFRNLNPKVMY